MKLFCKKGALKNLAKFTEKHLINLSLIKRLKHKCFPVVFAKFCQCCPQIETSQLICFANQWTGFYMRATLAFIALSISKI